MWKKRYIILGTLVIFLQLLLPVYGNVESLNVLVDDAYYDDLDTDGIQDDIRVYVIIEVNSSYLTTAVQLLLGIEMPSGNEIWFEANFDVTSIKYTSNYLVTFNLINTAKETGWYWAHCYGYINGETLSNTHSLYFDPPGDDSGDPGGDFGVTPLP